MAISKNILLQQLSGKIGKLMVVKRYYDKVVISKRPDMSRRVLSEKQKDANFLIKIANKYAKHQYYNQELKEAARLRLKVLPHKSLFHALVKEYIDLNKNQLAAEAK